MTLTELILASASFALVGLAVAAMLSAVAYGTSSSRDLRSLVVKHKTVSSRITAAVRGSHMVLASDADCIVLWTDDANADEAPQIGEIRRLEFDAANNRVRSFKADWTGMNQDQIDAVNTTYQLDADLVTATAALRTQSYFPGEVWANGVTNWAVAMNSGNPQQATLVGYRVALAAGDLTDTAIGTAALRNQ